MTKSVFTDKYDHFRKLLVDARVQRGLTQVDIAESVGRPQSFVSNYERGERRLDVVEFIEIAKAIGIDPKKLIYRLNSVD